MWGWIKRSKRWLLLAFALALLILLLAYLLPERRELEYTTSEVQRGNLMRTVSASGKIKALNTVDVGSEITGQVTRVLVDFDDTVRAGQLLAEIDPTRAAALLRQVEGQLSVALAAEATAQAAIERAGEVLALKRLNAERRLALQKKGFISRADVESAVSDVMVAKSDVQTARAQLAAARAERGRANAQIAAARLDLERTRIYAPIAGVVINRLIEPGSTITAGFQTPTLFQISADITRVQIEAKVDEADIGQVATGQKVRFSVDSYPNLTFYGSVSQVRKAAIENQNVVSYPVIIEVDNPAGKLLPGMTAKVDIFTGTRSNVLRIPVTALRFRPKAAPGRSVALEAAERDSSSARSIYIIPDGAGEPVKRRVSIGLRGDTFVEVTGGDIALGQRVVTAARRRDDDTVTSGSD